MGDRKLLICFILYVIIILFLIKMCFRIIFDNGVIGQIIDKKPHYMWKKLIIILFYPEYGSYEAYPAPGQFSVPPPNMTGGYPPSQNNYQTQGYGGSGGGGGGGSSGGGSGGGSNSWGGQSQGGNNYSGGASGGGSHGGK